MSPHDDSTVEQTKQPTLCVKCNSFFSNAACNDLCSKCHREQQAVHSKSQAAGAADPVPQASTSSATPVPQASTSSATPVAAEESAPAEKQKSSRCHQCRIKVGLCGFQCKCGQLFCGKHRYVEAHDCAFDYKTVERAKLADANPLVQSVKVQKL